MTKKTAAAMMLRAVPPWNSLDTIANDLPRPTEDACAVCLTCPLRSEDCDRCDGHRNVLERYGRGRRTIDHAVLDALLMSDMTAHEIAHRVGCSVRSVDRARKKMKARTANT